MADNVAGDINALSLDDANDDYDMSDSAFDDPAQTSDPQNATPTPSYNPQNPQAHEKALLTELQSIQSVNAVIEEVLSSLDKAKQNMSTINTTVGSATTLLDTWTRILSQTEHNHRLILDPEWPGASREMEELENESFQRMQAAAAHADAQRAAQQRAADEAAMRESGHTPKARGARGSGIAGRSRPRSSGYGRVGASGTSRGSTSYVGIGGQTGRGTRGGRIVGTSGIGRGINRGRGTGIG